MITFKHDSPINRQTMQATAQPIFTKTSINYYLRMEICASLAILPDQCLICLTKVQLLPPPLINKDMNSYIVTQQKHDAKEQH